MQKRPKVGLALGAGGVLGGAWLAGGLAAICRTTGWDAADADVIVGTSAGSVFAALTAAGVPSGRLLPSPAAATAERFHLFAVDRVSEGIEILPGIPAGGRAQNGRFPEQRVFGRVERRLIEIAERMRRAETSTGPAEVVPVEEEGAEGVG